MHLAYEHRAILRGFEDGTRTTRGLDRAGWDVMLPRREPTWVHTADTVCVLNREVKMGVVADVSYLRGAGLVH